MTKIKLCGLTRFCDIKVSNELKSEYVGFVFFQKSRRYITPEKALEMKRQLHPDIKAVGVFVNENPETVAGLINDGIIDIAQLHGGENEDYIKQLRTLTVKPIIKAFRIDTRQDINAAQNSSADYVLLDSGSGGTGAAFDWSLIGTLNRPYFLAGGLSADNVKAAVKVLKPYAVDVSSKIETDGMKDKTKMEEFVHAVRGV